MRASVPTAANLVGKGYKGLVNALQAGRETFLMRPGGDFPILCEQLVKVLSIFEESRDVELCFAGATVLPVVTQRFEIDRVDCPPQWNYNLVIARLLKTLDERF